MFNERLRILLKCCNFGKIIFFSGGGGWGGVIFVILRGKMWKRALNFAIEVFPTSIYLSKSLNFLKFLDKLMLFHNRRYQQNHLIIICVFVDTSCTSYFSYSLNIFSPWFEFSIWVLNFTCLNFARIFTCGGLILLFFYNREKHKLKHLWNLVPIRYSQGCQCTASARVPEFNWLLTVLATRNYKTLSWVPVHTFDISSVSWK